jgi:hypothetical protein
LYSLARAKPSASRVLFTTTSDFEIKFCISVSSYLSLGFIGIYPLSLRSRGLYPVKP